jgi:hypothetical protein
MLAIVIICTAVRKPRYTSTCDSVTDNDKPQTLKSTTGLIIFTACFCRINPDSMLLS